MHALSNTPFTSHIKLLEFLCVKNRAKPLARILCNERMLSEHLGFLAAQGMHVSQSSFKVVKTDAQNSYSDSSTRIAREDKSQGHIILYYSLDMHKAMQAKDFEEMGRHKELGRILGYPECCCDFFVKHFRADNTDLALDSLQGEGDGAQSTPWQLNLAARHFDSSLLFHFPCSMRCAQSLDMAQKHFGILQSHNSNLAKEFEKVMRMPALYTQHEGVFLLPNAIVDSDSKTLRFTLPLATATSKLQYALSDSLRLSWDGARIFVGANALPSNSRLILAR